MNSELDALIDTYFRTVPMPDRVGVLGQIVRHTTDQITVIGLAYLPTPGAIANRVQGVGAEWSSALITWNAYEWDV